MPHSFESLPEPLVHVGVVPRKVGAHVAGLRDHLDDLTAHERRAGLDATGGRGERQAVNMARRLVQLAGAASLPIVIHGKAYKPLVPYIDGSYGLLVEYYVRELGSVVEYVDPMTGDSRTTSGPAVFLLAHNATVTYLNTGVDSSEQPQFYCEIPAGSIILDPWRTIPAVPDIPVVPYGNTRIQSRTTRGK
jgi:hypothetical protein